MGLFDFLKGGKTEEKAPPKEAPAKPKEKPHAPERTAILKWRTAEDAAA